MYNLIGIDKEEIYDLLCECGMMDVATKEYGMLSMVDEDSVMDEFVPLLIDYINEKIENKLILE